MKGFVPDEIRLRREKTTFNEFLETSLEQSDQPALHRLLARSETELREYVRIDVIRDQLLGPAGATPSGRVGIVWRLATAETWLRFQNDLTFPEQVLGKWGLDEPQYDIHPVQRARGPIVRSGPD
jgi:hypothetical protein